MPLPTLKSIKKQAGL
ncbi:hypothetical protein M1719_28420 [Salmonella enterica subsp. enterica serovar Give]|nr:hypothetical protein [Salmonella enterica subsp. enterica serovar Give]